MLLAGCEESDHFWRGQNHPPIHKLGLTKQGPTLLQDHDTNLATLNHLAGSWGRANEVPKSQQNPTWELEQFLSRSRPFLSTAVGVPCFRGPPKLLVVLFFKLRKMGHSLFAGGSLQQPRSCRASFKRTAPSASERGELASSGTSRKGSILC